MTDQTDFTEALLDPKRAVPKGLVDPQGRPAPKRFDVYRNNVAVSLTDALETAFPVIHKLLGDDFFHAMAGVYLRAHPPSSALMMYYGAAMPDFLRSFEPVAHLPYLADVARLEIAMREAYHSADSTPIAPEALGALAPEELMQARFTLAPALRVVTSDWPIHALWQFNMAGGPKPQMQAQDVLVSRPEFDPQQTLLPAGAAAFITALRQGESLGAAFESVTQAEPDFDLSAALGCLLGADALTSITIGPPT
ncbi:MAG: DNA-binding domain-containing protein [Pseudomonadota bacterium]